MMYYNPGYWSKCFFGNFVFLFIFQKIYESIFTRFIKIR